MASAEAQEELEALESIFPETLHVTSPTDLTLSGAADGGSFGGTDYTAGFTLAIHFTPGYPEEAPVVEIKNPTGELCGDDKEAWSTMQELNAVVSETIAENMGMPMVFSIHAAVQERLEAILTKRCKTKASEVEQAKSAEIEAEIARYTSGTLVTPETFEEWKVKFEAEMAPMRLAIRQKNQTSAEGRMTGRQLFESKRMKNDSEKSLTTAADVFVDTSVFEGLDLGDLGDLDLEDAEGGAAASD